MYICNIQDITQVKELKNAVMSKNYSKEQEHLFYATVDTWLHDYNRLPNADEFPPITGVDSFDQVKTKLRLKNIGDKFFTDLQRVKEYTGKDTDLEIQQALNRLHKDYNFETHIIDDQVMIKMTKRPSDTPKEVDPIEDMPIAPKALNNLIEKVKEHTGVKINSVSTKEIATLPDFPGAATLKGFIKNGEVFVNTDNSTPDTPIHELMHLFMGSIRFENPQLYQDLLNLAVKDKNIRYKMNQFRHRTESDRAEEVLVEEVGKYLTGQESSIDNLSSQTQYELTYNIKRLLDTMLDGDFSVNIIEGNELYKSTLAKVAKLVNSSEVFNSMSGTMSHAFVHRLLNNAKADLLKSKKLIEVC